MVVQMDPKVHTNFPAAHFSFFVNNMDGDAHGIMLCTCCWGCFFLMGPCSSLTRLKGDHTSLQKTVVVAPIF